MYQELDRLIIENIKCHGEASLAEVSGGGADAEAERIARETGREAFRVIDCRLQALRKKGEIFYVSRKWKTNNPTGQGRP